MNYFSELNPSIDFSRYISLQAPLKLGFDDAIRARIECSICQPDIDAGPSADTFDQTAWIVYTILQRVREELKEEIEVEEQICLGIFTSIFTKCDFLSTYQ
jgi:hypothetical protein